MLVMEFLSLALYTLGQVPSRLAVHGDSKGVVGAMKKGRCRNVIANLSLERMGVSLASSEIVLEPVWVCSADNRADPPSRGLFTGFSPLILFDVPFEVRNDLTRVF